MKDMKTIFYIKVASQKNGAISDVCYIADGQDLFQSEKNETPKDLRTFGSHPEAHHWLSENIDTFPKMYNFFSIENAYKR